MLRRVSVRVLIPLMLVIPVMVVAGVLTAINAAQGQQAARAAIDRDMDQVQARVRERLDLLLQTPPRISSINAAHIEHGRLDPAVAEAWRGPLFAQTNAMSMLSGITWANEQGQVAWVFRYPGKPRPEWGIRNSATAPQVHEFALDEQGEIIEQVGGYDYDARARPWYIGALNADTPTYLEPYAWVNADGSTVTLGLPFVRRVESADGTLLGVLSTEIGLSDLSDFLGSLRVGTDGYVLITDDTGAMIANSLGAAIATDDQRALPATASENVRLASAAAAIEKGRQQTGSVLLRTARYTDAPGLDWKVVVGVPKAEVLAPLRAGRTQAITATIAAVLITVLLGLGIGTLMARPIRTVVDDVRRIGKGDLDHSVHSAASSELVTLSSAINSMTSDLRDRLRLRESLLLAMEVQKSLLPARAPKIKGLDIAGHCTYCDETGGDYYDYLDIHGLGETSASVVVGDVVGHGIAAAMLMATARGILRSRCDTEASLGDLLSHLNQLLYIDTGGTRFMTMLLTVLDTKRRSLTWASAGHDPPFLFKASQSRFVELSGGSVPLGILEDERYDQYVVHDLEPGDVLLLATDGLWEAHNAQDQMFGQDRVKQIVIDHAHSTARQIVKELRRQHAEFCVEQSPEDDITLVVIKILPPEVPG